MSQNINACGSVSPFTTASVQTVKLFFRVQYIIYIYYIGILHLHGWTFVKKQNLVTIKKKLFT